MFETLLFISNYESLYSPNTWGIFSLFWLFAISRSILKGNFQSSKTVWQVYVGSFSLFNALLYWSAAGLILLVSFYTKQEASLGKVNLIVCQDVREDRAGFADLCEKSKFGLGPYLFLITSRTLYTYRSVLKIVNHWYHIVSNHCA